MKDIVINIVKNNKLIVIDICLLVISVILSIFNLVHIPLVLAIVASVILILIVKNKVENYMSFPVIFVGFHVLYGLAGIVSKCWLNQMSATYGNKFVYAPYIIAYGLCTIALLIGIIIANKTIKLGEIDLKSDKTKDICKYFLFVAYTGFLLTSLAEVVNFFRVGGIKTILLGKAIYQAAVDELILTLPTQYMFQVSLAAFGIFVFISLVNGNKISLKKILVCCALAVPYLIMLVILGRRGPLLGIAIILAITLFQIKPLKRISIKLLLIVLVLYLTLGIVFAIRDDIGLLFTDFNKFKEEINVNQIIRSLNPALTEFGCTYGNFNKFYITDDYNLLYGKSYIDAFFHVIPSYLYPGDKPEMITYVFRDKYFPKKAEISSIASTGFSSILETYWNFWYFGAIIYVLYGYLIMLYERKLKNKSLFWMLGCLTITSIVYSFHRSELGHVLSSIVLPILIVLAVYIFYKYVYSKENKVSKLIKRIIK